MKYKTKYLICITCGCFTVFINLYFSQEVFGGVFYLSSSLHINININTHPGIEWGGFRTNCHRGRGGGSEGCVDEFPNPHRREPPFGRAPDSWNG